jgi:sterol desaturase/sphingolipid hydroxylase (fatty acid hydroxylase superfamily)
MNQPPQADSPFMKPEAVRLSFGTLLILLLMVVGAGVGLLIFYAMRVPAITSEINAWLGRPNPAVDSASGRVAQVTFVLFVYTAPLGLGMLVYFMHFGINWIDRRLRSRDQAEDEEFRME